MGIWGTRLATRRTFLLLRGSSVTERLRVAGNADWQEKRVPRCWPSVNGGTSGLEYGAGKPPPLNCQAVRLGSRSGPPPPRHLRSTSGARQLPGRATLNGTAAPEALAGVLACPAGARLQQGSCWSVPMVHREPPTAASAAASARLEEPPKARLAEWPYRYGPFILLRVMRTTQSSAASIWAGVARGLVTGVCAPSGHSDAHSQRFLASTP
jgi:hypothetical protein